MSEVKKLKSERLLADIRNGVHIPSGEQLELVIRLSIPAIMAQITSIIMQYIDAAMVGHLGSNASASIGLVSTTTWLFGSMAMSAASGFSVQVAQYIGAKKEDKARAVLRQSLVVVFIITMILTITGILISGILPKWLGGNVEIRNDAVYYFLIYASSLLFMGINCLAGSMLQCSGNMRIPSILNGLMCILDVIFNWILIFPNRNIEIAGMNIVIKGANLGVAGAALGTALAEVVVSLVMIYFLVFRTPMLRIHFGERFKPEKECVIKAAKISLPIAFEHFVVCFAMIVTTRIIAPLGVVSIAANSFAVTAESLCYMPGYGIADAATTLVGQSIGAGRDELTRRFARLTTYIGIIMMTCTGIIMYFAAPAMMAVLTPNVDVQQLGTRILRIEAFAEPMYGASIVVSGALRGAGDTLIPSIMNLISLWVVRIPLVFILTRSIGLKGAWIAMCVELIFRGTIFLLRLYRERWRKSKNKV